MLTWQAVWQLVVALSCAAAGVRAARRPPGRLLAVSAVLLFASAALVVAGHGNPANGLWAAAVLVTVPAALMRVVQPRARSVRILETIFTGLGLGAAIATAADAAQVGIPLGTAAGVTVVCAGARLFDQTSGEDRRRLLWVFLGFMLAVPGGPLLIAAGVTSAPMLLTAIAATLAVPLPITAAIAVTRPRIVDVRALIETVTVTAIMVTLAASVYIGFESVIVTGTGRTPPSGLRVLAAVSIAAAYHPVMRWVRASVNQMLFGTQADPLRTLNLIGGQLNAGSAPPQWLDTLREALAARGVALRQDGEIVASSGEFDTGTITELRAGTEHVGDLVVLPADDPRLEHATAAVVGLVSVPLAQALHAARLTEDLRASRGLAVAALEEERRRMRRDLHDGLGPTLTGIVFSADAAANQIRTAPEQAQAILRQLRGEAGEAINEIRRIVYGLRPRALDELGLMGAVRQQITHLRTARGQALSVPVEGVVPELPAAVEVVAYRTVVEAVTNVARHSGVAEATVELAVIAGPALRVRVADRGTSSGAWHHGVGLTSMRERLEEIGGTLTIRSGYEGAVIVADIPLNCGDDG